MAESADSQSFINVGCLKEMWEMSKYTLNVIKFDPLPLTLFNPEPAYKADEKGLEERFRKNRELMERLQKELNEKNVRAEDYLNGNKAVKAL